MSEAGERGFTLFEMLVVVAVLGLIGGLVWPSLAGAIGAQRARLAAVSAETMLRAARAAALRSGAPILVNRQRLGASAGVPLSVAPAGGIAFFPDGSSTGGAIDVGGTRGGVRYAVSSTGLVRRVSR